jgi:phage tail-like protein
MRGLIEDLPSPHPLAETLPSILRADPVACSLSDTFDELLAPAILSMDTFVDYLDPLTTAEDMLPWLAQWLGMYLDPDAVQTMHRNDLQIAGSLNPIRGTRRSIELLIEQAIGLPAEVTESGFTAWTSNPGGELPGEVEPSVTIVLHPPSGVTVDVARLDTLIGSVTPAHVRRKVSVQT